MEVFYLYKVTNDQFFYLFSHQLLEIFYWSSPSVFSLIFLSSLEGFLLIYIYGFFLSFLMGLRGFCLLKLWLQLFICSSKLVFKKKKIIMWWNYMTSYIIHLTQSRQFHIIIYLKVDFFLIICHLIYLTFLVNFYNQLLKSTFEINFLNQLLQSIFLMNPY